MYLSNFNALLWMSCRCLHGSAVLQDKAYFSSKTDWRRVRAANGTFCKYPLALELVPSPIAVKQPKYY